MTEHGFALFDTAVGRCAIAWGEGGIVGVRLPEGRDPATRARLIERYPGAREAEPPPHAAEAIRRIVALLAGQASDLSPIALDMAAVPPFHQRVYDVARGIPPGKTLSYGEIATRLGAKGSARAVGQALGRNPFALIVPCHRVLAANGKVGGFSAGGGIATKLRLLGIESAHSEHGATACGYEGDGTFRYDPALAVEHLRGADPALARVIDLVGPFRLTLKKTPSIFVALAESIVYQQLNGRAAATIFARLQALFPRAHEGPTAEQILRTSDAKLRGAGLSRSKLLALRDLAARTAAGEIPTLAEAHEMGDETVVERLTNVRGIGRWTVEMLLIFRLGRGDVLPVDDFGVRKGFAVASGKRESPTPRELATHGAAWAPYRSVASWYLWRAADLAPGSLAVSPSVPGVPGVPGVPKPKKKTSAR